MIFAHDGFFARSEDSRDLAAVDVLARGARPTCCQLRDPWCDSGRADKVINSMSRGNNAQRGQGCGTTKKLAGRRKYADSTMLPPTGFLCPFPRIKADAVSITASLKEDKHLLTVEIVGRLDDVGKRVKVMWGAMGDAREGQRTAKKVCGYRGSAAERFGTEPGNVECGLTRHASFPKPGCPSRCFCSLCGLPVVARSLSLPRSPVPGRPLPARQQALPLFPISPLLPTLTYRLPNPSPTSSLPPRLRHTLFFPLRHRFSATAVIKLPTSTSVAPSTRRTAISAASLPC
jgi:hypothetical protein